LPALDSQLNGTPPQRVGQIRSPDSDPRATFESPGSRDAILMVTYAFESVTCCRAHTHAVQKNPPRGHDPLTARFVDGSDMRFYNDNTHTGLGSENGGCQSGRPSSCYEYIDHPRIETSPNAPFSTRMRIAGRAVLSTVNTVAVIQFV